MTEDEMTPRDDPAPLTEEEMQGLEKALRAASPEPWAAEWRAAALRNAAPSLIAEVRRLREELNVTRNLVTMLGRDLDATRAHVESVIEEMEREAFSAIRLAEQRRAEGTMADAHVKAERCFVLRDFAKRLATGLVQPPQPPR